MTVKDRLLEFLLYLNISQGKFEKMVGLSNGFVNNIGNGISSTSINKIKNEFPILNTSWLLTGEGEMLDKSYPENDEVTFLSEEEANEKQMKEHMSAIEAHSRQPLNEDTINRLVSTNEKLAQSHMVFAESHKIFALSHEKLVDTNVRLTIMLEKATESAQNKIPEAFDAMIGNLLESIADVVTDKKPRNKNEVAALLSKAYHAEPQRNVVAGTQKG